MHADTMNPLKNQAARQGWALLCALAIAGCATPRAMPEKEWEDSPTSGPLVSEVPPDPFNPQTFTTQYSTPFACERQARRFLPFSRDDAWAALKACVEGTHFTLLQALTSRAWNKELRTRPEAAALIAKVVALRGGSVEGDLRLLHEQRLPIFSLAAAMAQPDTYKGRYILIRAQVGDVRTAEEKPTVWLVEQELGSVASEQQVGMATQKDTASTTVGTLGGETTLGSGNLGGSLSRNESSRSTNTVLRYDNVSSDTGREALGRLPKADPFLAPGRDFVILARFDGMRTTSGSLDENDEGPRIPVLSIVSYFIPHPLVVY